MRRFAISAAAVMALAACGSSVARPTTATTTTTSATQSTTASSPPAKRPATVHISDQTNHHTVTVHRGQTLEVTLHSTYWRFSPLKGGVLALVGQPLYAPRLRGCVPGQGCGTVTARYHATHTGTVKVKATRSACGEALRCVGGAGSYAVTVVVKP